MGKEVVDEVATEEEEFASEFEGAESAEDAAVTEEKEAVKVVQMLTEKKVLSGAWDAYQIHIKTIVPLQLKLDPSKAYEVDEVWALMNNAARTTTNSAFKIKGAFGAGGGGKEEVAKSKAHQEAIDLQKGIRTGAQGFIQDNHMDDFNKLQALCGAKGDGKPEAPISIEIYFKGWKAFVVALPMEDNE